MCGIFGIVDTKDLGTRERELLPKMGKVLRQRGPDDQGELVRGKAGLGATRLSIIDVAGGNQPLFNENKRVWAVQNGELYNYKELKSVLEKKGHKFSSASDTEVYAHLYEERGLDFVNDLRGMYAIGLWDEEKERLVLVRDRLGIKPLYFAKEGERLLFGSELKAIFNYGFKKELNREALTDYLSVNYVPGTQSIFRGIYKLGPGEMLIWEKGKVKTKTYWKPDLRYKIQDSRDKEKQLMSLLEEAVKYHLVSDVAVGAFLSGGVDSSVVVALAAKIYGKKLRTFAVGFEQESFNELKYAKQVAEKFGTRHEEIKLKLNPVDLVDKIGGYFDEPFADSSAVGVYAVSEAAHKKGMKVVLTGDGGDEVFGGYVTYQGDQLLKIYNKLPKILREKVIATIVNRLPASHGKMSFEFKAKRFVRGALEDPLKAHFLWKVIFTKEQIKRLTGGGSRTVRWWEEVYQEMGGRDELNKLMWTDLRTSLVDDMLTKVDRMSMANSLEVRVPLLDHKVVEYMAGLPSKYKVRGVTLKWLLKKSLREVLPDNILDRPKAGFHMPVAQWINGDLREMLGDYLSPTRLKKAGYFDAKFVQELLDDHRAKRADFSREIWGLLMFEVWRERWA